MHLGVLQKKVILSVNSRVIFPDVVSELIIDRNFFYFTQHDRLIRLSSWCMVISRQAAIFHLNDKHRKL